MAGSCVRDAKRSHFWTVSSIIEEEELSFMLLFHVEVAEESSENENGMEDAAALVEEKDRAPMQAALALTTRDAIIVC